jgi:hypothetical protein
MCSWFGVIIDFGASTILAVQCNPVVDSLQYGVDDLGIYVLPPKLQILLYDLRISNLLIYISFELVVALIALHPI